MSSDDIKHHVKTYIKVFIALMFLALITVGASYIDFDIAPAPEPKVGPFFHRSPSRGSSKRMWVPDPRRKKEGPSAFNQTMENVQQYGQEG